jgi:hypothetical protein
MPDIKPAVRTVTVEPPRASVETLGVVRAAFAIVIVAWFVIGLRRPSGPAGPPLEPYQVRFRSLPDGVQRVGRELLAGFEEALQLRTPEGGWPGVEPLAAEGIQPFAAVPGASGVRTWEFRRHTRFVNYVGRPAAASGPAFLLIIEEPDPESPDVSHLGQAPLDEFHRRVDAKTVLHVSLWLHDDPAAAKDLVWFRERAAMEGWRQITTSVK